MKLKKGISFLMAAALIVSSWTAAAPGSVRAAELSSELSGMRTASAQDYRYFYGQLTPEAKLFYDAMYEMYVTGSLKTGTADYDLVVHGCVSRKQMETYVAGDNSLLMTLGAARDAFYADYADVFYVDFSYLSIRVTRDKENQYHAYLGTGRSDNYFLEGFKSREEVETAVAEYEAKVNAIVDEAKKLANAEEQVRYVHDYIIKHTSYRLEYQCKRENVGHVRTAYGALVRGESVCEGYARAFKAVLDRLAIPCILVQGAYRASADSYELHMWNYVQLNGKWYAVDSTMDDPISKKQNTGGLDGYENTEYFLVGEDVMSRRHVPSGIMSEAEYEFSYPSLDYIGEAYELVSNDSVNGLVVKYNENGELEGEKAGEYRISYQNMGYTKAKEAGIYMLARYPSVDENGELKFSGEWGYITPEIYNNEGLKDNDEKLIMLLPQVPFIEFAVTSVAPGDYFSDLSKLYYQGDPMLLEAQTKLLYNPSGTYKAPPYIKKQTPAATGRITAGEKQHVTVTYDDKLIPKVGETVGYRLEVSGSSNNDTAKYTKIDNFRWDGNSTVEFDFTPSNMFADDCVNYEIYITGLMGAISGKTPNPISYNASFPCAVCAYRSRGYYWNVFGKPSLLENDDLSIADWTTKDGSIITQDMVKNLVLVASQATNEQADAMNEMVSGELSAGQKFLKSETYNINLTLCKKQVKELKKGQSVRVSLGFPDGYGPDDAGVTFKAYHFTKNDAGEIIGVDEIPCIITQYGLIILCDSFSPFAIVAVEDRQAAANATKTVILSNTAGGKIEGADNGLIILNPGESKTVTVRADKDYEIDELTVDGSNMAITDKNTMNVTVKYDSLSVGCSIADVKFAAKTVHEKDAARGETPVHMAVSEKTNTENTDVKAVTGVKAVSNATARVRLTWKKVSNAEGYYVYRYNDKKSKFERVANVKKETYTDKNCVSGQGYKYRVRAYRRVKGKTIPGKLSGTVKVIVMPKAPTSISGKRVSDTVAELSFKKVSKATEYRIYQSVGNQSKYELAYRVKGKKLYKYNKKSKKWTSLSKIKQTSNGKIICRLTGLDKNKTVKLRVITLVSKSGYKTASSKNSKAVTIRP